MQCLHRINLRQSDRLGGALRKRDLRLLGCATLDSAWLGTVACGRWRCWGSFSFSLISVMISEASPGARARGALRGGGRRGGGRRRLRAHRSEHRRGGSRDELLQVSGHLRVACIHLTGGLWVACSPEPLRTGAAAASSAVEGNYLALLSPPAATPGLLARTHALLQL